MKKETVENIEDLVKQIEDSIKTGNVNTDEKEMLKYYLTTCLDYSNNIEKLCEETISEIKKNGLDDIFVDKNFNKEVKRRNLYFSWVKEHYKYFREENNISKKTNYTKFKRGEVVRLNFGFNVGSEIGGLHYAVVVEKDDSIKDSTIVVVPLSTFRKKQKKAEELYPTEIELGIIEDLCSNRESIYSYALIDQIRLISKNRIYEPSKIKNLPAKLKTNQMNDIDEKIKEFFTNDNVGSEKIFKALDNLVLNQLKYKGYKNRKTNATYEDYLREEMSKLYDKFFKK